MTERRNVQTALWPDELEAAVAEFRYKPDWKFFLEEINRDFSDDTRMEVTASGLTFEILVPCFDSYHPERYRPVMHYHPVPAATFNRQSWERWIIDRVLDTERHEACEWARFVYDEEEIPEDAEGKGRPASHSERRPFAATHGPGDDPYVLHEYASELQRRTSYRGTVNA